MIDRVTNMIGKIITDKRVMIESERSTLVTAEVNILVADGGAAALTVKNNAEIRVLEISKLQKELIDQRGELGEGTWSFA